MKKFLSALMVTALAVSMAACSPKTETPAPETDNTKNEQTEDEKAPEETALGDQILIGGLAPLTGNVAVYGITATNGAKLAFDEINAKGGILGKQIKFDILDEKGDESEAVSAYKKLSSQGMVALLGDITSKPTMAVAAEAADENMPMVTPTATAADVTTYGSNIFRVCFIDPFQGETMANYASETLKAEKAAVLYNTSDDYSSGIANAFKDKAESLGIEVVAFEGHGATDVDFKTQLTNIKQADPDVLLIPNYYAQVALIAPQAKEVGLEATLLGADGWDGVTAAVAADNLSVLEDAYFCNHYSIKDEAEKVQNFITAYKNKYGEEPSAFAALSYDAAYIIANAIEKAGSADKDAINEALKNTEYDGVTGKMTFDENNNPVKAVTIVKIVNGDYTFDSIVEPK